MAISSAGIGSGLDVEGIVSALLAVEAVPLQRLQTKEATALSQVSAIGSFRSSVATFQASLSGLKSATTFDSTSASSSDTSIFTVSADSDASTGNFDFTVNRLAQVHQEGSSTLAKSATFGGVAGDALTLTVGSDSLTLDLETAQTLEQIRDSINADTTTGVSATIITIDATEGAETQRLLLSSDESGYDARTQFSFGGAIDASTFNFSTLNTDSNGAPLASLNDLDSSFSIGGETLSRASNTISDVVTGLTFELIEIGSGTVTVSQDTSKITSAVQGFVNSYNTLMTALNDFSTGSLSGSSLVRSVESRVRGLLNQSLTGLGSVSNIVELGVTRDKEGVMSLDTDKLTSLISTNRTDIEAFFSDSEKGFAVSMDTALDAFLDSDGIFAARTDGLNSTVESLRSQQESFQVRLEARETTLRRQYTALDVLLAQLSATSESLAIQLDALPSATQLLDSR